MARQQSAVIAVGLALALGACADSSPTEAPRLGLAANTSVTPVNAPPVAQAVPLLHRIGDALCTVTITPAEADEGSFDPNVFHPSLNPTPAEPTEGGSFVLSLSQTTFTGVGDHTVELIATDQDGLTSTATTTVRVVAPAVADVSPSTINKRARGQYITVFLEFAGSTCGRGPEDVDVSTVTIQVIDPVTSIKMQVAPGTATDVGDGNGNGVLDRAVKFDLATIQSMFPFETQAIFRIEGRFIDGTHFQSGDAAVQVIDPGPTS